MHSLWSDAGGFRYLMLATKSKKTKSMSTNNRELKWASVVKAQYACSSNNRGRYRAQLGSATWSQGDASIAPFCERLNYSLLTFE